MNSMELKMKGVWFPFFFNEEKNLISSIISCRILYRKKIICIEYVGTSVNLSLSELN